MIVANVIADHELAGRISLIVEEIGLQFRLFRSTDECRRALSAEDNGIVILDGDLQGSELFRLLEDFAVRGIDLPVVAILRRATIRDIVELMKRGVVETAERDAPSEKLREVIASAVTIENARRLPRRTRRDALRRLMSLTLVETTLLELLIDGVPDEIAAIGLQQPLQAIKQRHADILEKLGVKTSSELSAVVAAALQVPPSMLNTISHWLRRIATDGD